MTYLDELAERANYHHSMVRAAPRRQIATTLIYFVKCGDFVKVGISNPQSLLGRLETLQTGSPTTYEVLGTIPGDHADEVALHRRFAHLRARGEWFRMTPELVEYLADALRETA